MDRWLSTQASFAGDEQAAQESEQRAEQTAGLSEVRDQLVDLQEVNPTRIPVTFTMAQSETEQAELSEVPEAIPLSFYLWQAEGQWHLRQVVPGGPFTNTVPIREGQTEPPPELFAELDSKLRFPKGTLRYQIPGGEEAEVQVTGKMTPQEILGWVALALGLAALTATGVGALAGGAGLAALAGSAKGVAFTLAVGSTVAGAGSSGLSLGEQFQHGNPDGMQVTLDVVGLASSVLSLGSLVTGRIVVSQGARGTAIGNLAGQSYIPLVAGTVAADATGLTLLVVEAPGQIQAVMEGEGTEEEKLRALAVLLSQLAVAGVLTQISLQGDLADIRRGGVLQIDVQEGMPVARLGEADARAELSEEPNGGGSTRIEELGPAGNAPGKDVPGEAPASEAIRARATTPDGAHEIRILGNGRILRCSTCGDLRAHYQEFLDNQADPARQAKAAAFDSYLQDIELRSSTTTDPAEQQRIANEVAQIEQDIRFFAAENLSNELGVAVDRINHSLQTLSPSQIKKLHQELGTDLFENLVNPKRDLLVISNYYRAFELVGSDQVARDALKGILPLSKTGVSNAKLGPLLGDLVDFYTRYQGRVSGDFAARFTRAIKKGDPLQAQAELRLARDLLEGNTALGGNLEVDALEEQQRADLGRQTPDYRITDRNTAVGIRCGCSRA